MDFFDEVHGGPGVLGSARLAARRESTFGLACVRRSIRLRPFADLLDAFFTAAFFNGLRDDLY